MPERRVRRRRVVRRGLPLALAGLLVVGASAADPVHPRVTHRTAQTEERQP